MNVADAPRRRPRAAACKARAPDGLENGTAGQRPTEAPGLSRPRPSALQGCSRLCGAPRGTAPRGGRPRRHGCLPGRRLLWARPSWESPPRGLRAALLSREAPGLAPRPPAPCTALPVGPPPALYRPGAPPGGLGSADAGAGAGAPWRVPLGTCDPAGPRAGRGPSAPAPGRAALSPCPVQVPVQVSRGRWEVVAALPSGSRLRDPETVPLLPQPPRPRSVDPKGDSPGRAAGGRGERRVHPTPAAWPTRVSITRGPRAWHDPRDGASAEGGCGGSGAAPRSLSV
ncbi:hypothetical protein VULLAG_LOCUS14709 [Vulpes lagopus]